MTSPHPTIVQTYQRAIRHRGFMLGGLVGALALSILVDCAVGPAALSPATLLWAIISPSGVDAQTGLIVWQIRLPYALMAACVGAALGLAGAEMQTILANPLASPFTLGLSAAGAFGASLAIVLGWHINAVPDMWLTAGSAFVCAALSVWFLDALVRLRQGGTGTVILCGVALVFSFQALVALMQFVASEDALQNLVFWTLGNLTRTTWGTLGLLGGALCCIFPFSLKAAWPLTTLRMGEDRAASLGVDVPRLRRASLARISLLCALAVAFVGVIGFIGLVAPHIARRLVGEDHRFYLPASMLSGAFILSLSAFVARVLVPGVIVPTGIVTALVGIPFFLVIVLRRGEGMP